MLASGAGFLVPAIVFGQTPKASRRIAILLPGTPSSYRERVDAFRAELKRLGYEDGRDFSFELRWAENRTDRLIPLAAELVKLDPAVILTGSSGGVAAAKKATSTIPIVFASAASPVEQGLVESLRRPGGNVTGVLIHGTNAKTVEFARQAFPQARRLALLVHKPDPFSKLAIDEFVPTAKRLKFEPVVIEVSRAEELAAAFDEIVRRKADALYAPALAFISAHRDYLVQRSLEAKLPLLSSYEEITVAGGLLSYGSDRNENFRRAAVLVDKILRGANPAELAVEQPQKVELILNLKTAKAIGVKLPQATLQRADRVIQ